VWCILGNFNSVRNKKEGRGIESGVVNGTEIVRFNEFIENSEIHDISMVGRKYTWFRPNGKAMSRLDRALVTEDWLKHCPGTKQYNQGREVSDHCALKNKDIDRILKLFKFFDVWQHEDELRKYSISIVKEILTRKY